MRAIISAVLGRKLVAVTVRGISMEPTYLDGDRVLVRRDSTLRSGQVVVVEHFSADGGWPRPPVRSETDAAAVAGRHWIIKRVAAVAGDPVPRRTVPALAHAPGDRVPPGKVVLLGDNPRGSLDSRQSGYFPAERVLGAVLRQRPPARRS